MALSTLTLADLKTRCEDLLDIDSAQSDLTDTTLLIGVNDFLQQYQTIEMVEYPDKWRKQTDVINIPVDGYDLSLITDLYGTKEGFKVYLNEVKNSNRFFGIKQGGVDTGIFIQDNKLYIYYGGVAAAKDVVIEYFEKPFRFGYNQDIDATVIPIESGVERGPELMVASRYLERDQSDPQRAVNMRNDSLAEINAFFATNQSFRVITHAL